MPSAVSEAMQSLTTQKLYNLSDLCSVRTYNYEFPTYTKEGRFTAREQWSENATLWDNFSKNEAFRRGDQFSYNVRYNTEVTTFFLPEIDLTGLAIFGGSLTDALLTRSPSDIDFAYFCDEGDAEFKGQALADRVKKFVDDCISWMKKENKRFSEKIEDGNRHYSRDMMYDLKDLSVKRYRNCYSIEIPCCSIPIQIIHTRTLDSLLNGIDLDPTRMCFYNNELLMAESCKNAMESLAFVVNTNNVAKTKLDRVVKYFEKGFDLIFVDLDMEKLPTRMLEFDMDEMIDMPYLQLKIQKIEGNKLIGRSAPKPSKACLELGEGDNKLGYSDGPQTNVGSIIHNNIQNLARKEFEKFTFVGEGELYNQAFNENVTITERMLTNTYETAKRKIWNDGNLNFVDLELYLPYKPVKELVQVLMNEFIEERAGKKKIFETEVYGEFVEKKLKCMIADQIKVCKELIVGLDGKGSLAVRDCQDRVVTVDNVQFYGKYLKTADL